MLDKQTPVVYLDTRSIWEHFILEQRQQLSNWIMSKFMNYFDKHYNKLDWKNFINIKNSAKKNNSTIHNDTK